MQTFSILHSSQSQIPTTGLIKTTVMLFISLVKIHKKYFHSGLGMEILYLYIIYSVIWGCAGHLQNNHPSRGLFKTWIK